MSYSYEETTYSSGFGGNGASNGAILYGASAGSGVSGGSLSFSSGGSQQVFSSGGAQQVFSSGGAQQYASFSSASGSSNAAGVSGSTNQIASDLLALVGNNGIVGGSSSSSGASGAQFVSSSGAIGSQGYLSDIETAILRSTIPIDINESEEITVLGQRGIWANKQEVVNWRGVIPITQYLINEDANPEIITKRTQQRLEYIQELAIRYLRPPTPPAPGEIVITQEINTLTPPAPPLVIRQQPPRPSTPEPLVVREAPPQPPAQVGRKVITISGKRLPPPPRKVVIERLAPLPSKPQSVIVERWLPYSQVKRRVIFNKSNEADPVIVKPRNVIIQWEAPQVVIKKDYKYLGVIRANPAEYVQRYGATLKAARELPDFVLDIKTPEGLVLAADYQYNSVHELEGEVQALRLVDLDREGLSEYRAQLQRLGISYVGAAGASNSAINVSGGGAGGFSSVSGAGGFSSYSASSGSASTSNAVSEIFAQLDRDANGSLTTEEAEKILLRLNSRLGRRYGEDDVKAFFSTLDVNRDGSIDLREFRNAFQRLL